MLDESTENNLVYICIFLNNNKMYIFVLDYEWLAVILKDSFELLEYVWWFFFYFWDGLLLVM